MKLLQLAFLREFFRNLGALVTLPFLFRQEVASFFSWREWPPKKRTKFLTNIFWGLVILVLTHFAPHTRSGQQLLNDTYDSLVQKDYAKLLVHHDKDRFVSDALRIVLLDKNSYESGPGKGYWTPRDILGQAIEKSIQSGAKVILVDFALNRAVPLVSMADGHILDENADYLRTLAKVAHLAREKGAVVIFPDVGSDMTDTYAKAYAGLLEQAQDVFKRSFPGVYKGNDGKVRHMRFVTIASEGGGRTWLSMPLLGWIYYGSIRVNHC